MRLEWRTRTFRGLSIDSSVTDGERIRLEQLAKGGEVLEIGSAYGYTTCFLANVAARVIAIDPHAGYGSMPGSLRIINENIQQLGLTNIQMLITRSDLALPPMLDNGHRFDLIFVDGDHRVDAAYYDVAHCWNLLAPDGTMAIHDYGEETCPQVIPAVDRFVAELTAEGVPHTVDLVDSLCTLSPLSPTVP